MSRFEQKKVYIQDVDSNFTGWKSGGEDYITMNAKSKSVVCKFAPINIPSDISNHYAAQVYASVKKNNQGLVSSNQLGTSKFTLSFYDGESIESTGNSLPNPTGTFTTSGSTTLSESYQQFITQFTLSDKFISSFQKGLVATLDLTCSRSGTSSYFRIYAKDIYLQVGWMVYTVLVAAEAGGSVSGGGEAVEGQSVTLTAAANPGYKFKAWVNSNGDIVSTNSNYTFTQGNSDVSYTAQFEISSYTLTVTAGEGGTVTGGGKYSSGATVTITATPNSGYRFVKWSDGNTNATRTVTVTSDATYTATFALLAYVTYDSIFSLLSWRRHGISGSNAAVSDISNTGFTLTSNAGVAEGTASSHYFAVEAGKSYKIDIDITGDNWDVYIFFCDADGAWIDFSDSKNRFSSNGGVQSHIFTAPSGSVKAQIRVDANGASNAVSYSNFRIYPAEYGYMSDTVSALERTDIGAWSMPTPTRSGYKFVGWNTKPDGTGTTYTASSGFPVEDTTLYSQWKNNSKIYSGTAQIVGAYIGTLKLAAVCIGTGKIYES